MKSNTATSSSHAGRWCVAVIGADRAVLMTERGVTRRTPYVPPGIMSDPCWLLDTTAGHFEAAGEGTLITRYVPLSEWGGDNRSPIVQLAEFMGKARAGGWQCTDAAIRHQSGWVTFTRPGSATVHLGVLDAISEEKAPTLFAVDDEPEHIAEQLATYAAATGVAYRQTPGVGGLAMIRKWYANRALPRGVTYRDEPRWQWHDAPDVATPGDLIWQRYPTRSERERGWVHAYDINAQYLAAADVAELAWDRPTRTGAIPFDPRRPGLWRIVARASVQWGRTLPPFLNPARVESDRTAWVSTPALVFLHERRIFPEVLDSWTAEPVRKVLAGGRELPGAVRILRPWAEHLRDARAAHPRPTGHGRDCRCGSCRLAQTIKDSYTFAVGMMAGDAAMVIRPDWAATIRDLARFNLLRKLLRAHENHRLTPLRVYRDCVWFVADNPDASELGKLLGVADQIGRFKIEWDRCGPMSAYLDEHRQATARRRERTARRGG